jgi:cobalamin-dependent methionine synthase I
MKVDKNEVSRYLRYKSKKIDKFTDRMIDECIDELEKGLKARFVFKVFPLQKRDSEVLIEDTTLVLKGKDIYKHLQRSEKCAIMAATLGLDIDKRINYYNRVDMTKSVIMDACATAAIEAFCDQVQNTIGELAAGQGYSITGRFSPGYGDLPIEIQPEILNVLNAQVQIGLTATDSLILIPRKSVTAIIGFTREKTEAKRISCKGCSDSKNCMYAKEQRCYVK